MTRVQNTIPQLLGRSDPQIQKVMISGTMMYRARLMALDQKTAEAACVYLTHHGQGCIPVGP